MPQHWHDRHRHHRHYVCGCASRTEGMTASAAGHAWVGTPACMPRDVGIPFSLVRAQSQTVRSLDAF
jgi:hypothetical protein